MANYNPIKTYVFPSNLNTEKYPAWVQFRLGTSKRPDTYIALPTPPNISFNTNIQYNDVSLGIIDGAFDMFSENMTKTGGDIFKSATDTALGVWNSTANSQTAKSGGISTQVALASSLFSALKISTLSGIIEPVAILAKQELRNRGVAVNPNTELYFQDVGLRSFNFSFRLAAKNLSDSAMIIKIVQAFEYAAHPEPRERLLLEYPDECIITFFEGSVPNDNVPAINRCVIKSFTHTYNADSNVWFENGMPSTVDISIAFQEVSTNTKKTINRLQSDTERNKFTNRKGLLEGSSIDISYDGSSTNTNTSTSNQDGTGDTKAFNPNDNKQLTQSEVNKRDNQLNKSYWEKAGDVIKYEFPETTKLVTKIFGY